MLIERSPCIELPKTFPSFHSEKNIYHTFIVSHNSLFIR